GILGGTHVVAPLYFLIYAIQSPVSKFDTPDRRSTQISYMKILIPCLISCYYIPGFWITYGNPSVRSNSAFMFILLPAFFRLLHVQVSSLIRGTTVKELIETPNVDMPYIRITYYTCALLSGAMSLLSRGWVSRSLLGCLFPISQHMSLTVSTIHVDHEEMAGFVCGLIWVTFEYIDLSSSGMMNMPWLSFILAGTLISLILGPAAALMLGWGLREEYLAKHAARRLERPLILSAAVGSPISG
ncbi:hypothetical protein BO79DRAFT_158342, partial [Aspergillus costaricaensis CBS 115574]